MANAIEDRLLFSDGDNAELLSSIIATTSPVLITPAYFWASSPELVNGNGVFSDDDNAVLLLTDAVFQGFIGGQSEPPVNLTPDMLSDTLQVLLDSISGTLQHNRSASVSDTLRVITDAFGAPSLNTSLSGAVADALKVITDAISTTALDAFAGNISDTLPLIQDAITWAMINIETPVRWVAPVTITPKVSTINPLYLAAHAVRHPTRYYEPRVKSYGTFTRAISAPVQFIRTGDVNLTVIDSDNSVRQRLATKTIRKAKAEVRLGPEGGSLAAFLRPLIREVATVGQPSDGQLSIPLRDFLFEKLEEKTPETWTPSSSNFADAILYVLVDIMGVEESLDRINFASFDQTRTRVADLVCSGTLSQSITYAELLTRLQRSSNIDIFADKNDRLSVHYTTDDEEPTVSLDDLMRIYKGTVSQQLAEPTFNQLPYKYNYNAGTDTWTEATFDNEADQEALGEIVADEPLLMYFVADAATALAVIERRAQYLDLDSFRFSGEIPLIPVLENLELADLVGITHFGGIKSGGYVAEQFKILELSMDVDHLKYRFKGIRRRLPPPTLVETEFDTDVGGGDGGVTPGSGINGLLAINSRPGPFYNNVEGELFSIWRDRADTSKLKAWRTTDYGDAWQSVDVAGQPNLSDSITSYDCYQSGSVIHVATQESVSGRVAYHTFDMATATWATVDDEVVASVSDLSANRCVSIECRNPGGEPVIFFQGDRELLSGNYYMRGFYSILQSGAWSVPAGVTPDPGGYAENNVYVDPGFPAHATSSNCVIERVVAGRANRLHFFYTVNPGVFWVQWSPDEYVITLQENLTFNSKQCIYATSVSYPSNRDIGGILAYDDKIAVIRKLGWGDPRIDIYAEGPDLLTLYQRQVSPDSTGYSSDETHNPSTFMNEIDGVLYAAASIWYGIQQRYFASYQSSNNGDTWTAESRSGPLFYYPSGLKDLNGLFLKVRGNVYMAYFGEQYRWIKVANLPYTP